MYFEVYEEYQGTRYTGYNNIQIQWFPSRAQGAWHPESMCRRIKCLGTNIESISSSREEFSLFCGHLQVLDTFEGEKNKQRRDKGMRLDRNQYIYFPPFFNMLVFFFTWDQTSYYLRAFTFASVYTVSTFAISKCLSAFFVSFSSRK